MKLNSSRELKSLLSLFALVSLAALTGCQNTPVLGTLRPGEMSEPENMVTVTNQVSPALLQAPTNRFTLGPGDEVEIVSLDDPSTDTTTVVGPDGKLYFDLLPGIDVWGLTLPQARALMERGLAKYFKGQPQVNVTLRKVESKRVWLLGRLQQPGVYNITTPMTLLEAISMAGGPLTFTGTREVSAGPLGEELADLHHSFVVRDGKLLPVDFYRLLRKGDLSQNIYLEPDDFVYFAPKFTRQVYVLGAVVQPKPVSYTDGLTVAQAIAGAYGTVRDAYLNHVVVVRGSLSEPKMAVVNYREVVHGKEADFPLQAGDIVYVPYAPYRYLRKYLNAALDTFVSAVAINAGISAVPQPNTGGAGIFIPAGSGIQVTPPPAPPIQ